ncbi:carboxyl transferase domain-containing protein [Caenimonas sp. SL110]|uniref:acetyl-CoA carboxylase family protein n=1 Tax=Caenimonas sp. SL110 TaxID=1450524 RepID=UPI000653029D|nr:carboxyl transferase domain-containing protein [Caenimonas sp. SL110]
MSVAFKRILIANRGEIAIRIARAAGDLGIRTVSVASTDDADSLHCRMSDENVALPGTGAAAYLDMDAMLAIAARTHCDAIHPGYGFLSENAGFARRARAAGIAFIGPSQEALQLFGDKAQARRFAAECGVPIPAGTQGSTTLEQARAFMQSLGHGAAVMVKALSGGGGRGMRQVESLAQLDGAFAQCASEALKAFGNAGVYVEQVIPQARHIEIQVLGDGRHAVHLGDRDCSVQRRYQKLVEIAPSPWLAPVMRAQLADAALRMAAASRYETIGTFEFLVPLQPALQGPEFFFIEANPRLQVEHTVTEELTGIDLVATQIRLAAGETLRDLGIAQDSVRFNTGHSIQLRVLMEQMTEDGGALAVSGALDAFEPPAGPGVRVDTHCHAGYAPSRNFDSLLAKVIVTSRSSRFEDVLDRAYRAIGEFNIAGVENNLTFLQNLLVLPEYRRAAASTAFVVGHHGALVQSGEGVHRRRHVPVTASLPRAVNALPAQDEPLPQGFLAVDADMRAGVAELCVQPGQRVSRGQQIAVLEAMKMEHSLAPPCAGWIREVLVAVGDHVQPGQRLFVIEVDASDSPAEQQEQGAAVSGPREDLQEVRARHALTHDDARPEAVAKRRATGQRTARENLADLCDPGSFREYGSLAVAAQRSSRSFEELQRISPADGFIYGLASINSHLFGPHKSRCMVASPDYTVFSGTQGFIGHKKLDRLFELAEQFRQPLVLFTEGGGGRALDTDNFAGVNLANPTFWKLGRLSGLVPLVGIVAGPCFAASAAMLGCCDVTIAARNASIGMGGPVMIEGAGLGRVRTIDVGPAAMHADTGVVDVLVDDEAQAVEVAKRYLAFFQGSVDQWSCDDQEPLREAIPERRTRVYEIRDVIRRLADTGSTLELRAQFGRGVVTTLARIEGRAVGVVANDPRINGGAVGADEADKLTRFMKLCSNFGLPIVSLCDTPGFMVGVDAERTALVRHVARIFMAGPKLRVPFFTVVLRKAYGLGGMAMGAGCFAGSLFAVAWPTGEFGSMGLEGQARLAHRRELEAIADANERALRLRHYVDQLYARNKAVNIAPYLSIDDVIDPADTRQWLADGLRSACGREREAEREGGGLDAW